MKRKLFLLSAIQSLIAGSRDVEKNPLWIQGMDEMNRLGLAKTINDRQLPLVFPQRSVLATGQSSGFVGEDVSLISGHLAEYSVLGLAGARYLTDLKFDAKVPAPSSFSVAWKGENTDAADSAGSASSVSFTPKRATGYMDVSRLLLQAGGPDNEQWLTDILLTKLAALVDSTVLGVAAGSTSQPQGMGYKITTGSDTKAAAVVPDFDTLLTLEKTVHDNNALPPNGSGAYITSALGAQILKKKKVEEGFDTRLLQNGIANSYPVFATNAASDAAGSDAAGSLLVFGNFQDLGIALWPTVITVDPFVRALAGIVRITVSMMVDVKGLRGSYKTDEDPALTDADEYSYAFSSAAIKES